MQVCPKGNRTLLTLVGVLTVGGVGDVLAAVDLEVSELEQGHRHSAKLSLLRECVGPH